MTRAETNFTTVLSLRDELSGPLAAAKGSVTDFESRFANLNTRIEAIKGAWQAARAQAEALQTAGGGTWESDVRMRSAQATARALGRDLEELLNQQESLAFEAQKAGVAFDQEGRAISTIGDAAEVGAAKMSVAAKANENVLERNRTSIQRVATAGSQLALVGSVVGGAFGDSIGPLSEFLRVGGNIGLVASTTAELGPAAAKAGSGFVSMAKDAATAATSLSALKAAGVGLITGFGPAAVVIGATALAVNEIAKAHDESAQRIAESQRRIAEGTGGIRDAEAVFYARTHQATQAVDEQAHSLNSLDLIVRGIRRSYELLQQDIDKSGIGLTTLSGTAQQAADAAETHRLRLLGETDQLEAAARQANSAKTATEELGTALDDLPRDISIKIDVGLTGAGAGAFAQGFPTTTTPAGNTDFGPTAGSTGSLTGTTADPEEVARQKQRAAEEAARKAEEAARKAKQAAEELARAYDDKVDKAFRNAQKTGETLLDALHDRILRNIQATEKLAQSQHDQAVQAIADNLKAEQAQHAIPVNAAEAALRQREAEQQRRDLVERLQAAQAAAQANTDPTQAAGLATALRDAQEALQNFDAQAIIDRLKVTQAAADAASQSAAAQATAAEDAKLAAAERQARLDTAAENTANRQRIAAFDKALAALNAADRGKPIAQINADIAKLQAQFGVVIDPVTGAHHIVDPVTQAIKTGFAEAKAPVVNNFLHATLQIGASDLRLLASALQSTQNPAASSGVRTGSGGKGR